MLQVSHEDVSDKLFLFHDSLKEDYIPGKKHGKRGHYVDGTNNR